MSLLARTLWLAAGGAAVAASLSCTLLSSGCVHGLHWAGSGLDPVCGHGPMQGEVRPLAGPVRSIAAAGAFRIRVVAAATPSLELRAPADVLPLIETALDGDRLRIGLRSGSRVATSEALEATIGTPGLGGLRLDGACQAEVEGLSGEQAVVELGGASEATVRGAVRRLRVGCMGASRADLSRVAADRWEVDCSGASSCTLAGTATEADLDASGAAAIHAGNLHLQRAHAEASGTGRIELGRVAVLQRDASGAGSITAGKP